MNFKIASGMTLATLGLTGLIVIIFFTGPEVSVIFSTLGFSGFVALFSFGLYRMAAATIEIDNRNR